MRSIYPAPYNPEPKNHTWLIPVIIALLVFLFLFWKSARAEEIDLSIIAQIESNNNDLAVGKSGEKGRYQIMDCVLREYNARHSASKIASNALFSPVEARKVANWYLAIRIPQMLAYYGISDTLENRIRAWNSGIGTLKKGKYPKTTKQYFAKYKRLAGIK